MRISTFVLAFCAGLPGLLSAQNCTEENENNWQHFSVLGFEQAGASSTTADQRFFFDFYVTRHLSKDRCLTAAQKFAKRFHWWGNIRLASFPQQINAPIGQFTAGLGTSVSEVKVNEFVQSSAFRTGLDVRLPWVGSETSAQRLSFFAGFGGVGPLDPKQGVSVFRIPAETTNGSTARNQFFQEYPKASFPGLDTAKFVAFTDRDRARFYRQYAAGIRYTQLYDLNYGKGAPDYAPASVAASFGQHELISAGRLRGVTGIFEGFFPFKLGSVHAYLFGRALMGLSKNQDRRPVFLEPAIEGNAPVPPSAPDVYVIATPSNRDVYTIGIGIDAVHILEMWTKRQPQPAKPEAAKPPTPSPGGPQ